MNLLLCCDFCILLTPLSHCSIKEIDKHDNNHLYLVLKMRADCSDRSLCVSHANKLMVTAVQLLQITHRLGGNSAQSHCFEYKDNTKQ